ncbi:MAG: hypothetical protein ACREVI_14340, partial [Steroidobacteraceae bacterium]
MTTSLQSIATAGVAATLLMVTSIEANAQTGCVSPKLNGGARSDVGRALSTFGSNLVALGRVDRVSAANGIDVLGYRVQPAVDDRFQVGDYAAVIDWSRRGVRERVLEVRSVPARYVPGASEVFLKSAVSKNSVLLGRMQLSNVVVDYSSSKFATVDRPAVKGTIVVIRGTQPSPNGLVLSNCIASDGSMGTGRADGSMGTGRTNGSMGTGRADGSMGTGRTNGSMGTGRTNGSMGTG